MGDDMTLLHLMDWFERTTIGTAIKESLWLFPVIESGHLLGLALLGGTVLVIDLRLLGWGVTDKSPRDVLKVISPWMLGALVVMFATGIPLFLSEAIKCYNNDSFVVKMIALVLGLGFTFGIHNRLVLTRELTQLALKALGVTSIALWGVVAAAGRWVGFS